MIEALKIDESWIDRKGGAPVDYFDTLEYEDISNELKQVKDSQKIEQWQLATKLKILLSLGDFWIKKEDFELVNEDWTLVVISNSSYFSSIVGLNWIQEKENSRSLKDRSKYDWFDNQINDFLKLGISRDDAKTQLKKYCDENDLDFESMIVWWGCVISEWDFSFIWLKKVVWNSGDIIEKNKWTIAHEGQHIKFDNYCKEKWIEKNWNLAILDEVIAHCFNTFDKKWNIDFTKIYNDMVTNDNYFKKSLIKDKPSFENKLYDMIQQTKVELQHHKKIYVAMKNLIEKHK